MTVAERPYDAAAAARRQAPGARSHRGVARRAEAAVCADVDVELAATPRCHMINVTGSAEQTAGTPDRVGVVDGRAFACEVKAPGGRPRPLQVSQLRRWQAAGALVGWVTDVGQLRELLARVHDRQWVNPLTGPGDPTRGETRDAGTADDPRCHVAGGA